MKPLFKTLGLAAALALALFAGQVRAQDSNPQFTGAPPPNGNAPNVNAQAGNPPPAPDSQQAANQQAADSNVSFQTFYDQLSKDGTWIQTDKYGYVFQPKETDPNWAPYTYGHWVNTDAGMTWDSVVSG